MTQHDAEHTDPTPLRIAMVVFPRLTQLDFTAPFEVFARVPDAQVAVVSETAEPVVSDTGLAILPTHTFETAGAADVLFVPGGPGQIAQMTNDAMLGYLRRTAADAAWVTSVCTGSLLLAAAGLLEGHRATCHWLSIDQLSLFGVEPQSSRVVVDRNRITGAGITSGIDFALAVVAKLRGEELAKRLTLQLEYDPEPPFRTGHPRVADAALVEAARRKSAPMLEERRRQSLAAAARLGLSAGG
ncbi:DJ-1/PfpI family protein [Trinickia terrae]|uniref:DJ-1/PfpI family protein n=1 Tax=Trinickia terrae TaxID=2571161 RepID=A0A4U1HN40_9BURK|nr:DJ-1/PfpI family protein [Trinickia terrae]TKC81488.1 DJ-1/PfpI family protein [Trinickia terrae]